MSSLRAVIREQSVAVEELHANNRELAALLVELSSKAAHPCALAEPQTAAEAPDPLIQRARQGIAESARLRQQSQRTRAALGTGTLRGNGAAAEVNPFSRREQEVLDLIVAGQSGKEIAAALGISFKTVVTHRTSIMSKLRVHEIASVVREAIRRGLVT